VAEHENTRQICSVVDRHRFDSDPDPTFHFIADPDPDPDPDPTPSFAHYDVRKSEKCYCYNIFHSSASLQLSIFFVRVMCVAIFNIFDSLFYLNFTEKSQV
jgi:hypothetical protein